MTDSQKPKESSRKPRVISLDLNEEPKSVTRATKKPRAATRENPKPKSTTKAKRKPRSVPQDAPISFADDEAAQRYPAQDLLADQENPPPLDLNPSGSWRWGRWLIGALFGIATLGLGLWLDGFVRDLFARGDWLGWVAIALVSVVAASTLALISKEILAITRMAKIERYRIRATEIAISDDMKAARSLCADLSALYKNRPDTAQGRAEIERYNSEIIDGSALLKLAERDLMKPLDEKARVLVMASSKRVSVVTAVSPRAVIDVGYVLLENFKLIRRIADLYGGRPGTLGFWKLTRNVVAHLAMTGTIALGDGVIQQLVGQGLAALLSSRLGEGVINGMLTARIGIAAISVCRPLPFGEENQPAVKDFLGALVTSHETSPKN